MRPGTNLNYAEFGVDAKKKMLARQSRRAEKLREAREKDALRDEMKKISAQVDENQREFRILQEKVERKSDETMKDLISEIELTQERFVDDVRDANRTVTTVIQLAAEHDSLQQAAQASKLIAEYMKLYKQIPILRLEMINMFRKGDYQSAVITQSNTKKVIENLQKVQTQLQGVIGQAATQLGEKIDALGPKITDINVKVTELNTAIVKLDADIQVQFNRMQATVDSKIQESQDRIVAILNERIGEINTLMGALGRAPAAPAPVVTEEMTKNWILTALRAGNLQGININDPTQVPPWVTQIIAHIRSQVAAPAPAVPLFGRL